MIVARYFSTIRHPPVLVASQNSSDRVGWLIAGIKLNYPLKSLAKSIAFVSLQQRVRRSGESPSFWGYEARQLLSSQ